MTGVASMAAAITPADNNLNAVIELLLWMRRAEDVWLLQLASGPRVRGQSKTWLSTLHSQLKAALEF
jgi:hypothetical protein